MYVHAVVKLKRKIESLQEKVNSDNEENVDVDDGDIIVIRIVLAIMMIMMI